MIFRNSLCLSKRSACAPELRGGSLAALWIAILGGLAAVALPLGSARADALDELTGDWLLDISRGGDRTDRLGTVEIRQEDTNLRATWSKLSSAMKNDFGFEPGDVAFEGALLGQTLVGRMRLHYPIENREACPDKWQTWERLEVALPVAPRRLQGRFRNSAISARDCSTEDRGWLFLVLTRPSGTAQEGATEMTAAKGILAESGFDAGDEGWILVSPLGNGKALASHHDAGGNPGGYIGGYIGAATSSGAEAVWEAPIQFLGDRSSVLGGVLLFDLRGIGGTGPTRIRVTLGGAEYAIHQILDAEDGGNWQTFSVRLSADGSWREQKTGAAATDDNLRQILSSLRSLRFEASPAAGLDNVVLSLAGATADTEPGTSEKPPARVRVNLVDRSAVVGKAMNLDVALVDAANQRVVADKLYRVDLSAEGATVRPERVEIPAGAAGAAARVYGETPGAIPIRGTAANAGLDAGTATGFVCASGPIARINFGADAQEVPLGGSIHATLDLVNETGSLVSDDGQRKRLNVEIEGVGRTATPNTGWIDEGRCTAEFVLASDRPGESPITVSLGAIGPEERTFRFYLPLNASVFLAVVVGGLLGGFARAATIWKRSRRWKLARWTITFAAAVISGLAVFLVYHFGVIQSLPRLSGGIGLVVLLSLVGGYLGPTAIERIADRVVPPGKGN